MKRKIKEKELQYKPRAREPAHRLENISKSAHTPFAVFLHSKILTRSMVLTEFKKNATLISQQL